MEIKYINNPESPDANIPNEPFTIFGRMIPALKDGVWSYSTVLFPEGDVTEMTFPPETYTTEQTLIGAYEDGKCVGLAVMEENWSKYMYLYDLKVCRGYRRQGAGEALIDECKRLAVSKGYRGVYTIGQDNNLAACKFYLKNGFRIGGFTNRNYDGTSQEGKGDIYFYFDDAHIVIPTEEHLDRVREFRNELLAAGGGMDGTGPLRRTEDPEEWLKITRDYTNPETVPQGKVVATQFLYVRTQDEKILGMVQVRHYLNEYLRQIAGHIGYSIRPSERRKGYASAMVKEALEFCRSLGLDRVMISCEEHNEGSRRTILSAGGVYEHTVTDPVDGEKIETYWITL